MKSYLCFLLISVLSVMFSPQSRADNLSVNAPDLIKPDQTFKISTPKLCDIVTPEKLNMVELRIAGQLSNLKPLICNPGTSRDELVFYFPSFSGSDADASREIWIGSPWSSAKNHFRRDVEFYLGLNDGVNYVSLATGKLHIQVLQLPALMIGTMFIFAVAILLLKLGKTSDLLRDASTEKLMQRSYSLSRVQMAWWFFIVLASYVWLWIVGEGIPDLSTQALGLLGIGSLTYVTAASLDASKSLNFGESEGFWKDILSYPQGLTLSRVQLLVFNLLFGILFMIYVLQHVRMPELDSNILLLLGLSSGTYAGFKILPDNNANASQQPADPKQGYTAAE
jgi:hypothetical protein